MGVVCSRVEVTGTAGAQYTLQYCTVGGAQPQVLVQQPPVTTHHTTHGTQGAMIMPVAWVSGQLQPGGRGGMGVHTEQHAWATMQHYVTNANPLAYVHNKIYIRMSESEEPKTHNKKYRLAYKIL